MSISNYRGLSSRSIFAMILFRFVLDKCVPISIVNEESPNIQPDLSGERSG
jgi:hypothetical protein